MVCLGSGLIYLLCYLCSMDNYKYCLKSEIRIKKSRPKKKVRKNVP